MSRACGLCLLLIASTTHLRAEPIPVVFDKELKFSRTHSFKKDDSSDLGRRYIEFKFELEKGDGCLIEMSAAEFEPAYILYDNEDRVAWRDDGGFENKRVVRLLRHAIQDRRVHRLRVMTSKPDVFGEMRITFRRGVTIARGPDMIPEPHVRKPNSLVSAVYRMDDLLLRRIELPHLSKATGYVGIWDPQGKFVYGYDYQKGTIHKVRFDEKDKDFITEAEADIGKIIMRIGWSAEGLVASVNTRDPVVHVIDPDTLKIRRTIKIGVPVQNTFTLATHHNLSTAVFILPDEVLVLDLKKGEIVMQTRTKSLIDPISRQSVLRLLFPVLSPDGKYFFAEGGVDGPKIFRCRIAAAKVVLEEGFGPEQLMPIGRPVITPDGKYVGRHSAYGDHKNDDSIPFYPLADFSKPAFTLPNRYAPVSFDDSGRIYAKAIKGKVFDIFEPPMEGKVEPRHYLWTYGQSIQDLQPHPRGVGFLALVREGVTDHAAWYVERVK